MRIKFIRPRTTGHGSRSVERTVNVVPTVGQAVQWNDTLCFTVEKVDWNLNVTPGQSAPGKASATITLA